MNAAKVEEYVFAKYFTLVKRGAAYFSNTYDYDAIEGGPFDAIAISKFDGKTKKYKVQIIRPNKEPTNVYYPQKDINKTLNGLIRYSCSDTVYKTVLKTLKYIPRVWGAFIGIYNGDHETNIEYNQQAYMLCEHGSDSKTPINKLVALCFLNTIESQRVFLRIALFDITITLEEIEDLCKPRRT